MWEIVTNRSPTKVDVAVEIGTQFGTWAAKIPEVLGDRLGRLFCVDPWGGGEKNIPSRQWSNVVPTWFQQVEPWLWTKIFPLRGTSVEWAQVFPYRVDLLYIDGKHTAEAFMADLDSWIPLMNPGGLVICHDYSIHKIRSTMRRKLKTKKFHVCQFGVGNVGPRIGFSRRFVKACWFNTVEE